MAWQGQKAAPAGTAMQSFCIPPSLLYMDYGMDIIYISNTYISYNCWL